MHQPFTIKLDYYKGIHICIITCLIFFFPFYNAACTTKCCFRVGRPHQKAPSAVALNALQCLKNSEGSIWRIKRKTCEFLSEQEAGCCWLDGSGFGRRGLFGRVRCVETTFTEEGRSNIFYASTKYLGFGTGESILHQNI